MDVYLTSFLKSMKKIPMYVNMYVPIGINVVEA